jgi:hypothetical protein
MDPRIVVTMDEEITENGRLLAAMSYLGMMAFPIAFIPLLLKQDAFSMHHAKHAVGPAVAIFVFYIALMTLTGVVTTCTFGWGTVCCVPGFVLPVFWMLGTGGHGVMLALDESWDAPIGSFGLGARLLESVKFEGDGSR